jgi:hypothetical protein
MKALFSKQEFKQAKVNDKLPCECYNCKKIFYESKRHINELKENKSYREIKYCSHQCRSIHKKFVISVVCKNCNNEFFKRQKEIRKTKNHFCSRSCAAIYNNTHKAHGTRRSKLEIYLEKQLTILYPGLHIDYNKTEAINSELNIYIPSLKLAFELNGIFHYEPIYGQKKLDQTQNNDQRKFQACIEKNISLCILDVSGLNYFKPDKASKFLKIITEIINSKNCC